MTRFSGGLGRIPSLNGRRILDMGPCLNSTMMTNGQVEPKVTTEGDGTQIPCRAGARPGWQPSNVLDGHTDRSGFIRREADTSLGATVDWKVCVAPSE
jgi:hypothetical protein